MPTFVKVPESTESKLKEVSEKIKEIEGRILNLALRQDFTPEAHGHNFCQLSCMLRMYKKTEIEFKRELK